MTDDRTYRLLIPGALFVFTMLGFALADPTVKVLDYLKNHDLSGSAPLSVLVLGGSLCVVVTGYVITTITYGRYTPDVDLCGQQKANLRERILHHGASSHDNLVQLSIYTHLSLGRKDDKLMNHLSRSWSNELIANSSLEAIKSAILAYGAIVVARLLISSPDWISKWSSLWDFESGATLWEFFIQNFAWLLLFELLLVLVICKLTQSRNLMKKYRHQLYQALLAEKPNLDTELKIEKQYTYADGVVTTETQVTKSIDSPK